MLPPHPLHSLFAARHIAVIGASQRSETLGGRVFASMLTPPFQGRLTPVNLRHPTVAGLQAYAQISQIDDKPDAAIAVCHAAAHPGIAAACIRLRIPHLLCIADDGGYDGESLARLQKAAASGRTQITLCSADGFNLPAQNLYANAYSHAPEAGKIAVVGFTEGFCSDVMQYLRDSSAGYSFTVNLIGQLATPLLWLDWFREDTGSHILIVQYPAQPDAAFFSTLRQAAQRKNVILYTGRSMCGREKQIAHHLAERSGALPAFTPDELRAAVWAAQMPRKLRSGSLHVLSDSEAGWLCDAAEESGLKVHRLPAVGRHSNALVWRDIAAAAADIAALGLTVQNIYVGGGTPTSLSNDFFAEMLEMVYNAFYGSSIVEFTVEAGRPDSMSAEKISCMKKYRVTRVSVNPQSMQERTLRRIGRRHTPAEVVQMLRDLRAAYDVHINMDVILGLPGETAEDVASTMAQVTALAPDDITLHALAIKRGSQLRRMMEETHVALPSGEETMRMSAAATDAVRRAGYRPYYLYRQGYMSGDLENVGYARPGAESMYNVQIMEEQQTIIGIGGAATTKVIGVRGDRMRSVFNAKDLTTYLRDIDIYIEKRRALLRGEYEEEPRC